MITQHLEEREQSARQKERNRTTIRICKVANGFLTTRGDTGETQIAPDLDTALDQVREFYGHIFAG